VEHQGSQQSLTQGFNRHQELALGIHRPLSKLSVTNVIKSVILHMNVATTDILDHIPKTGMLEQKEIAAGKS
jgi:hypothetical protein